MIRPSQRAQLDATSLPFLPPVMRSQQRTKKLAASLNLSPRFARDDSYEAARLEHEAEALRYAIRVCQSKNAQAKKHTQQYRPKVQEVPVHLQEAPPTFSVAGSFGCDSSADITSSAYVPREPPGRRGKSGPGPRSATTSMASSVGPSPRRKTVMQREELEVMENAKIPAEERVAELSDMLAEEVFKRSKRERALQDLQTELADLEKEHHSTLLHERHGLDDIVVARSVYDMHSADLSFEDHYTDVLKHMHSRLQLKAQHFEKRITLMRADLIAVTEEIQVFSGKLEDAQSAASRARALLDATQKDLSRQQRDHQAKKTATMEKLREGREEDTSGAPDTAAGEVDPAAMGAAELKALHERQLMAKAAGGRGSHSPVMDKAERLKDLWGQLAQVAGSGDADGILDYYERANEARQLMDQSQVEMEVRRKELEETLSQIQRAEDARQQAAAEDEAGQSGDNRLKTIEMDLYKKERENEKLREKAYAADTLYKTIVEQLDSTMKRVALAAKARPADVARANAAKRQDVMEQQMVLESMEYSEISDVAEKTTQRASQLCVVLAGWVALLASILPERLPALKAGGSSGRSNVRSGPAGAENPASEDEEEDVEPGARAEKL